uniref:Peptidase S1 domain-containing protein n=1 Tax=Daphnia galeata TaxID=27404 RepID=A0A8J2S1Y9_9CRUS|nr:unnamed protein product [Daphnia galeata]
MSRLPHFALFFSAAVHLLLFSICPVSSRIYETNDAVVIEKGEQPNALQQATVEVISNAQCNVPYKGAIKRQQFCAEADGKDSCQAVRIQNILAFTRAWHFSGTGSTPT